MHEMPYDDEDPLFASLEHTEIVMEAWIKALPWIDTGRDKHCLQPEEIEAYVAGSLDLDRAISLVNHLGNCRHCRNEVREALHLAAADSDTGRCNLDEIRKIMRKKPEMAARALVLMSKDVVSMTLPAPLAQSLPQRIDLGILSPHGEPTGRWFSLLVERPPYIDADYRLCLDFQALPKGCEKTSLRILFTHGRKKIEVGTVLLNEGMTKLMLDLSDLCVKPGFFSLSDIELMAEQLTSETSKIQTDVLKTGPQTVSTATQADKPRNIMQTMTADQLSSMLTVHHQPSEDTSGTVESTTKVPRKRRK